MTNNFKERVKTRSDVFVKFATLEIKDIDVLQNILTLYEADIKYFSQTLSQQIEEIEKELPKEIIVEPKLKNSTI